MRKLMSASGPLRHLRQAFPGPDEFYLAVLESMDEGIVITDAKGHLLYSNSQMEAMCGCSRRDLEGTAIETLLLPSDQSSKAPEHLLRAKDGSMHWVQVKETPLANSSGEIVGTVAAITCIEQRKELEQERHYLLDEIRMRFNQLVGRSLALRKVLDQIQIVAPTHTNVLVMGESGTGKELIARTIHDMSERKSRVFVRVDCASMPKDTLESELFGHLLSGPAKTPQDRISHFELAEGGTLFLDEVGDLPLDAQAKLLHVLQGGQFEDLGDQHPPKMKVRVIAATHRDLAADSKAGRFREDLYYRLSVFSIQNPPLRDRADDIPALADHFVRQAAMRAGVPVPSLSKAHLEQLQAYAWPGNVRELRHVVERAVILSRSARQLYFDLGQPGPQSRTDIPRSMASIGEYRRQERELILATLERTSGRIYGPDGAAALLGMRPTTLSSRLHRYGVPRATRKRRSSKNVVMIPTSEGEDVMLD